MVGLSLRRVQALDQRPWESGARGLRAIMEEVLLETMYELPSRTDVKKCVVDENVILERSAPKLILQGNRKSA